MGSPSKQLETSGFLRKLVLMAVSLLGLGYILVNLATAVILGYLLSQIPIASLQMIREISSMALFLLASILLILLGTLFIFGGFRFYKKKSINNIVFMGLIVTCFYLLCLGVGIALVLPQTVSVPLILSPILIMVTVALCTAPSPFFKFIGSTLSLISGILLAILIPYLQPLGIVLGWKVPFTGPFMSVSLLEGIAVFLGSITVFTHLILAGRKEATLTHIFLSIVALIYGISVFTGPLVLSFSFLDLVWKAPWLPPLYGLPGWVVSTTVFWSASLLVLTIAGVVLMISSCLGFVFAARELHAWPSPLAPITPVPAPEMPTEPLAAAPETTRVPEEVAEEPAEQPAAEQPTEKPAEEPPEEPAPEKPPATPAIGSLEPTENNE